MTINSKLKENDFYNYRKEINWALVILIISVSILFFTFYKTTLSFDVNNITIKRLEDLKTLGDLPNVPPFVVASPYVDFSDGFFWEPLPNGGFRLMAINELVKLPGTLKAGMPGGWDQQAFLNKLIEMLKAMNEAKSQKLILTLIRMIALPIMFISYIINYIIIGFSSGGINQLIFGGDQFVVENIPVAFWIICISVPLVLIIIFLFQTISMANTDDKRSPQQRLKDASIGSFKTVIYIFCIPVGFWIIGTGLDLTISYISFVVEGNPQDKSFAFTDNVYKLLFFGLNPTSSGDFFARYPVLLAVLGGSVPGGLWKSETIVKAFTVWGFIGLAIGGSTLIFLLSIFAALIEKTFWLFFNFLICIYYACASAFDGGARMKMTREKIIAKTLSIAIITLGINLTYTVSAGMQSLISFPPITGQAGYIIFALIMAIISIAVLMGVKKIAAEVESQIGEYSNYSRIDQTTKSNFQTGSKLASNATKTVGAVSKGPLGAVGLTTGVIGSE
ncbi:hypothetical protein EELLY_v1c03720 [Entomoplasma ellychniae]|uniref:Uncharacterized protein n=1 Tax=Entomoplasma ellychniae TaxID=2114 RepID=A0A8E2UAK7_9MOLU|nr:hypothetical protein [Entomoplasma ellychniae]PPE04347.1 hypothetical protein EELLY_v1c00210 [Entomoplasma ellychniae]PPE04621.1 hypothetical protein EELLY_v1c03010 [Entomoplasma ellychniae]PPE04692.1 hypothetical protein EELLY_v1c03720 [Entomoplasma ellychniae]